MKADDTLALGAFRAMERAHGHVRVSDWYDALVPSHLTDQEFYDAATRLLESGHIGWGPDGRRLILAEPRGLAAVALECITWAGGALLLAGVVWAALGVPL